MKDTEPKRILIDQDGVLANFEKGFLDAWRAKYPDRHFIPLNLRKSFYIREDYPLDQKADIEAIYTTSGFIKHLEPIPGAIEALRQIKNAGHIVRICTSPLSQYQNCVEEKYAWVEIHLGKDWVSSIIIAKDKTEIRGDILIDDRPQPKGELKPVWEYVLFDQPYNKHVTNRKRLLKWADWQNILLS